MEKQTFLQAFIKAKNSFDRLILSKSGNKNKYADIEDIREATEKHLHDNAIMLIQTEIQHENGSYLLKTQLKYEDEIHVESIAPVIIDDNSVIKNPQQQYGAALSYARRYSAMTVLGLRGNEKDLDDYDHSKSTSQSTFKANQKQLKFIDSLLKQANDPGKIGKILSFYSVATLNDLTSLQASAVIKQLKPKDQ